VSYDKRTGRFCAKIQHNSKKVWLGRFKRAIDAARAYDKKAIELHGEFACLNFPEEERGQCGVNRRGISQ